jgi:hypothetical protein
VSQQAMRVLFGCVAVYAWGSLLVAYVLATLSPILAILALAWFVSS